MDDYFCQGEIKYPVYDRLFQIILCWRLIQTNNMIMKIFTLQILRLLNNLLKNNSLYSCVKTFWLGVRTSCIFISVWVIGGDYGFASALDFCLVNTRSNSWSFYLMLDLWRLFNVANHTDWNLTKVLYIPRKFSGYSVYTLTIFNGAYTKQVMVHYLSQQSQVQTVTRQNTKSTT